MILLFLYILIKCTFCQEWYWYFDKLKIRQDANEVYTHLLGFGVPFEYKEETTDFILTNEYDIFSTYKKNQLKK